MTVGGNEKLQGKPNFVLGNSKNEYI